MKSNVEWFNELPEPYRLKALNNAEKIDMLGKQASSLSSALCAFTWAATPEGQAYWQSVFDMVKNNNL
jgi:hypothetical protein